MNTAGELTPERAARVAQPLQLGILISGRGSNMAAILQCIAEGRLAARARVVISDREDAAGLVTARHFGVEALWLDPAAHTGRLAYQEAVTAALQERGVDTVALAGFMRLLRPPLLDAFPGRILNIHPSLLPAFKGLHAQQQALEYGVKVTGCSVHFVTAGMDAGPVVLQAAVPVAEDDTEDTLAARVLAQEHRIYPLALQLMAEARLAVCGRRVQIVSR